MKAALAWSLAAAWDAPALRRSGQHLPTHMFVEPLRAEVTGGARMQLILVPQFMSPGAKRVLYTPYTTLFDAM